MRGTLMALALSAATETSEQLSGQTDTKATPTFGQHTAAV